MGIFITDLDTDKTCHNAVSRIIAWLAVDVLEFPSEDNSGYFQARKSNPSKILQKLFINVGNELESKTTPQENWCGRHVKVLDGSTVSMPDTIENQKAYPQPSSQKAGCGREGGILSDLCNLKVILWRYSPLPAFS